MITEIQQIEDALFGSSGNMILVGIGIMAFIFVIFLIFNIDFRLALLFDSPLILAFSKVGWFPSWVGGVFWVLIVGIGIYMLINIIRER